MLCKNVWKKFALVERVDGMESTKESKKLNSMKRKEEEEMEEARKK